MRPGRIERRTHDSQSHGSLFAALDTPSGKTIGPDHPATAPFRGVRNFLDILEKHVPAELDVHLFLDNYATTRPG
jgi:hypothetical protein